MRNSTLRFCSLLVGLLTTSPAVAAPMFSSFYGESSGGAGSADVTVFVTGNVLTMTLDNTSPTDFLDGDAGNAPGVTGFGLNLETPIPSLISWSLTAYRLTELGDLEPVTIGADPTVEGNLGSWILNQSIAGVQMDFLPTTTGGNGKKKDSTKGANIKGALYNPDVDSDVLASPPNYFTTATFVMTFSGSPTLSDDGEDYFVRMQNVGLKGSLKLYGDGTFETTPEPSSMALFGIGLACCSGWTVRRRRQTLAA